MLGFVSQYAAFVLTMYQWLDFLDRKDDLTIEFENEPADFQ